MGLQAPRATLLRSSGARFSARRRPRPALAAASCQLNAQVRASREAQQHAQQHHRNSLLREQARNTRNPRSEHRNTVAQHGCATTATERGGSLDPLCCALRCATPCHAACRGCL